MIKYIHIVLAIWSFAVVAIFAEDYPNRPTAYEMQGLVVSGTQCARGMNERCWATQYQTNPVAYYVVPFTNTTGFYLDQNLMGTMATNIRSLVSYYVDPDTVYNGTTNISMLSVSNLWVELDIGDHTNQFTQTFASGTNSAVYGDSPWRICYENLYERYEVLNAMKMTVAAVPTPPHPPGSLDQFSRSGDSYASIAAGWGETVWDSQEFTAFAAAWVDNYGSGPWTVAKFRGSAKFTAPAPANISYTVDLYGHVVTMEYGDPAKFSAFEAPGKENEYVLLETFTSPLTPLLTYSNATVYGNSTTIVPDPGSIPAGEIDGWLFKSYATVDWNFQYCE